MAKVIKSFSLDDDVAKYLDSTGNASGEVNTLVRRRILSLKAEELSGTVPTAAERETARRWARTAIGAAREDVENGAYDEIRRDMGWAS